MYLYQKKNFIARKSSLRSYFSKSKNVIMSSVIFIDIITLFCFVIKIM